MSLKKWLNDHNLAVSCLGVTLLVIALNLCSLGLYQSFTHFPYFAVENRLQDWIVRLGKPAPQDPRIYFLYDDAASHNLDHMWEEDFEASPILRKMKTRAWPREVHAAILDRIAGAGARVVGFDYVFQGENPQSDPLFHAALDKYRNHVVLGLQLDDSDIGEQRTRQLNPPPTSLIPDASDPRLGFINVWNDPDGIVRRFRFRFTLEEMAGLPEMPGAAEYESLPVRILRTAGLAHHIPAGRDTHMLRFAYRGETRQDIMRPQSVANIFSPTIWEANYQNGDFFKDKIVLVGPTGNLNKDVGQSQFGLIGGPEFHLNVMHALLAGGFLKESPQWMDLALILLGGLLAWSIGYRFKNPLLRTALASLIGAILFGSAVWLLNNQNLIIQVFSPLLSLLGSGFTFIVWQQIIERLEKAKMRRTFERYVSRDVVKELIDNPESYLNTVGGARKVVTVLFSDVRGFTTITESGDAQELVKQLNEYFDAMVNIVFANRGTLDKFIGDAVMAQWGGITSDGEKQDAINAVRTAVQMRKKLAQLNTGWITKGMLELKFGIGVNTGEAIVGNLGCEAKMEVSLIGDPVNTASRLEGITKIYHNDLVIGETAATHVRDTFYVRTVGLNKPKGKTRPLELFTVIDEMSTDVPSPPWLPIHEKGVNLYRARDFSSAAACFEAVLKEIPDDWLAFNYLQSCRKFALTPPGAEWDAVEVMESK